MTGRYRTVALQAIGVAAIAAFIFFTFLRPDTPGDLSGIEAPGSSGGPIVVNPDPNDDQNKNGGDNDPPELGPRGMRGGPQTSGGLDELGDLGDSDSGPGVVPGGDTPPPPGGDGDGEDPPDSQYEDLVSRLMEQVGRPSLFREIDP